jgi:uncharacterized LabA/DUF88 family protein
VNLSGRESRNEPWTVGPDLSNPKAMTANVSISYLFIDGACLNAALDKIGERYLDGVTPPLDWSRVRARHRKVFYYDAIPVQKSDEDDNTHSSRVAPKRSELARIARQDGYHVRTGEAYRRRGRGNEQKMVDVQLAVDALLMASRGLFGSCTLITGDLDFKPLVSALVEMGVNVELLYPKDETNEDLKAAADRAEAVTIDIVRDWSGDAQRGLLPFGGLDLKSTFVEPHTKLFVWRDENYGDCYITNGSGLFELRTERAPEGPETHRLYVRASTAKGLRAYAEEKFDLIVPPIASAV